MLIIRLSRQGKRKEPYFWLIISEKTKDTVGDYLESLGFYDPRKKVLKLKEERIKYWLGKGAKTSATVHNLLVKNGLIKGKKAKKGGRKKLAQGQSASGGEEKKSGEEAKKPEVESAPAPKETKKEEKPAKPEVAPEKK